MAFHLWSATYTTMEQMNAMTCMPCLGGVGELLGVE